MTVAMSKLADGDTGITVPALDHHDEVGDMARAVQVFKENAIEMDRLRHEQEDERRRAETRKRQDMNRLANDFEATLKTVVETVGSEAASVEKNARALASIADGTRAQAIQVAAASEQASSHVAMVAAATEQLTASGGEIAGKIGESAKIARDAVAEPTIS